MKIAILGPAWPWRGGIAHYSTSLYDALIADGHQVDFYNFQNLYPDWLFPGKTQKDQSARPFTVPGTMIYDPLDPRTWVALIQRLHRQRPDRLILQWWHPYFAPGMAAISLAARTLGIDTLMLCHNVEPHEASPLDRTLLKLAYALPTRFLVQSRPEAAKLRQYIGHHRPITVVPHPRYDIFSQINPSKDHPSPPRFTREAARQKYGITHDYSLLFFGLIRPYKGLHILIEALATLTHDPDQTLDIGLHIVGEVYGKKEDYLTQIKTLNLTDRIIFDDRYIPNEEVPTIFAAADACVLPYLSATASGIANIALTHQTPLIMSKLPTLHDAFPTAPIHWSTPANPTALAHTITHALTTPTQNHPPPTTPTGWQKVVAAISE